MKSRWAGDCKHFFKHSDIPACLYYSLCQVILIREWEWQYFQKPSRDISLPEKIIIAHIPILMNSFAVVTSIHIAGIIRVACTRAFYLGLSCIPVRCKKAHAKMKKVLLFLAKGFETYEASVFIDVIGWNLIEGDGSTRLFTCGLAREVTSTFNVIVRPDFLIDNIDVDDYDALSIPGGFETFGFYEDAYNERFLDLIREFHKKQKIIASICVGALPIGKSGILKGRKATTYNMGDGMRQKQLMESGAEVLNQPIVVDDCIITSWNPSTAMEVAFKLLELLTSREKSDYIKKIMGFI